MRVLIVDDEPLARARLRRLLAEHPDILVVGEADRAVDFQFGQGVKCQARRQYRDFPILLGCGILKRQIRGGDDDG